MPKAKIKQSGLLDSWGRKNRKLLDYVCQECGKVFHPRRIDSKYCSNPCRWKNNGGQNKKSETWWVNKRGYVEGKIWLEDGTQIQVKKHRFVMEKTIGRKLLPTEDVHHIDGNKQNNDPSNLRIILHDTHSKISNVGRFHKRGYKPLLSEEERKNRSDRAKRIRFWENGQAALKRMREAAEGRR